MGCTHSDANRPAGGASEPRPPSLPGFSHQVEPGDTLWSIAQRYGTTVEDLLEINGLEDPGRLQVGQRLFIPQAAPVADSSGVAVRAAPRVDHRETADLDHPAPARGAAPPLPGLQWPIEGGVILRDFSPTADAPVDGLVLAAPAGTPVRAASAGKVLFAGDEGGAFGNLVILEHTQGRVTVYGHLTRLRVKAGDRVSKQTHIADVGASGDCESPQLHFQVRSGREPEDPLLHLPPP